jgi:hypothetical protein
MYTSGLLGRERWNTVFHSIWILEEKRYSDCLSHLTTDISTLLEMKEQTVAAFLDVSLAYDNVLIDIYVV